MSKDERVDSGSNGLMLHESPPCLPQTPGGASYISVKHRECRRLTLRDLSVCVCVWLDTPEVTKQRRHKQTGDPRAEGLVFGSTVRTRRSRLFTAIHPVTFKTYHTQQNIHINTHFLNSENNKC